MDRLDVLKLFMRVAEASSFSKAGRSVGLGQPSVSKHIGALEARLQTRLFRRSSRQLALTREGQAYYEGVKQVLHDLESVESGILAPCATPSGTLRVSVVAAFGRLYLMPRLAKFYQRYPELTLELDITERYVNLAEDGVDMAVRVGHFIDPRLSVRQIGSARVVTVATPAYLAQAGEPKSPAELHDYACIGFMHRGETLPWEFNTPTGKERFVPKGPLSSNDAEYIFHAVLDDVGIAHLPTWLVGPQLRSGTIVRILETYTPDNRPISAVWPTLGGASANITALVDFLCAICADHPELSLE